LVTFRVTVNDITLLCSRSLVISQLLDTDYL